jgi:hypothetical protein
MPDDDDILETYERELGAGPLPPRRTNRGFWLVAGTMIVACVFLVVEIFVNFDTKDTIAHAEYSLRVAAAAAKEIADGDLTFEAADAAGLTAAEPAAGATLTYLDADTPSRGLDEVSVAVDRQEWAAAVQARPGACFHLRLTTSGDIFYAVTTDCRGTAALAAADDRW